MTFLVLNSPIMPPATCEKIPPSNFFFVFVFFLLNQWNVTLKYIDDVPLLTNFLHIHQYMVFSFLLLWRCRSNSFNVLITWIYNLLWHVVQCYQVWKSFWVFVIYVNIHVLKGNLTSLLEKLQVSSIFMSFSYSVCCHVKTSKFQLWLEIFLVFAHLLGNKSLLHFIRKCTTLLFSSSFLSSSSIFIRKYVPQNIPRKFRRTGKKIG